MYLFHYTSAAHLRGIHKHGLTVGDVVTNLEKYEGQIAVWLTSSGDPNGHGLANSLVDKTEFRLTVEVEDDDDRLWKWSEWASQHLDETTQSRIQMADGYSSSSWYLFFGWVPRAKIIEVVSTKTGRRIDNWAEYYPEVISARPVSYEGRFAWQRRTLRDVKRALERMAG